jgi:hypothetical protein
MLLLLLFASQVLADYPAGTFLKLGNTNAAVLPKVPKTQRMPGECRVYR